MNLYLLSTKGLGDFYVVATDPTSAESRLKELLTKSDYGFYDKRKVEGIKMLAEELGEFPNNQPNFSSGNNLILPTTLIHIK